MQYYHLGNLAIASPRLISRSPITRFLLSSSSSSPPRIGFIGLGNMGLPMCQNLATKANNKNILAFDSCEATMRRLQSNIMDGTNTSVTMANTVEEIAEECSLIFTMLPGCDAVNTVMEKLATKNCIAQDNKTFVDCSTVHPKTSRYWSQYFLKKPNCTFVDAPVSGGVAGANSGTLTFMVGSDDDTVFERVKPYLECMGTRVVSCGGPGSGAVTKLCNNLALATQMIGICEAVNLGEAMGVDPTVLADVMNSSTASCWSSTVNHPHPNVAKPNAPAANGYQSGFASKLMLKDLGLAMAAANDIKVTTPLGSTAKELYVLASQHGFGEQDFGIILQLLRGKSNSKAG